MNDPCACLGRMPSILCKEDGRTQCDCTIHHSRTSSTEKGGEPIDSVDAASPRPGLAVWMALGRSFGSKRDSGEAGNEGGTHD